MSALRNFVDWKESGGKEYAPHIPSESCGHLTEILLSAGRLLRCSRVENTWLAENADKFYSLRGRCKIAGASCENFSF